MFRPRLCRCGQRQHRIRVKAGGGQQIGQRRGTKGQGSGLVKRHQRRPGQSLQGAALAKQQPQFRAAPAADQNRHRGCQPQGTGAGHDQHRNPGHQRMAKVWPEGQPQGHGSQRHPRHHRHKHPRHPVDQRLHRQFAGLRLFDQRHNPRQQGIGPDPGDVIGQGPGPIDGAAHHCIPRPFGHRHRFAGQHRLIHPAVALNHHAIGGQPFAGAHINPVADAQFRQRQVIAAGRARYPRRGGLQRHQPGNRLPARPPARLPACPRARAPVPPATAPAGSG